MTNKIGGYPSPAADTKPSGTQSSGASKASEQTKADSAGATRTDEVSLTDTATRLKSIEARISELPEVDQQRVAQIRELIDSGEYTIDARLIAQRLVQLEQALS